MKDEKNKQLTVQVTEFPSAGLDWEGDITFANLDVEEDGFTRLPYPMHYQLHLEQVGEDLIVRGHLEATIQMICDRCAEFADCMIETDDVCHRYEKVIGQVVDLTDDLREDILIEFPTAFLCSESCRGLCPQCGANLNEGDCGCVPLEPMDEDEDSKATENPWAALDSIKL